MLDNSGNDSSLAKDDLKNDKRMVNGSETESGSGTNVDPMIRDGVDKKVLAGYAVGHLANDLCASMWFIYLSYYLLHVVELDSHIAGLCLLSGQIADGITTPLVGFFSDKLNCKCGKRNAWYYFGSILVAPSFLCIFLGFDFFESDTGKDAWYLSFPAIFNVGWAAVQISTMSIVNQLSYSQRKRDTMANYRNGFTFVANIFILTLALILFATVSNKTTQFRILGLSAVGLGAISTLFYVSTVREPQLTKIAIQREAAYKKALGQEEKKEIKGEQKKGKTAGDWLKEAQFYIFALVYMFARISLNTTATILPLYLDVVNKFKPPPNQDTAIELASVPLASYVAAMLYTICLQKPITQKFRNRLIPMGISIVVTALGSFPMAFLGSGNGRYAVYVLASL